MTDDAAVSALAELTPAAELFLLLAARGHRDHPIPSAMYQFGLVQPQVLDCLMRERAKNFNSLIGSEPSAVNMINFAPEASQKCRLHLG